MSFDKRNEEIRKQRELRRTDGKKTKVKRKKTKEEKEASQWWWKRTEEG